MAGRRTRDIRAHDRSSAAGRSWPAIGEASAAASGSSIGTVLPARTMPSTEPSASPRTRSTYRLLVMRGLAPDEAANLTAFMSGIPVTDGSWTLTQVNRLLFLRELHRTGRVGDQDGIAVH